MSRRNFSHLLQKYLDGRCSGTEKELVESWFSLLDDEERWQQLTREDLQHIEQKLWGRLQLSIQSSNGTAVPQIPAKKIFRLNPVLRAAAAVIFLVAGAALIYNLTGPAPAANNSIAINNWIKKSNDGPKPVSVQLEDGSQVELTKGATVYYPQHFEAGKREVKIEGTAFFQIVKDTAKPFFVHSQDLTTRVLGTSFWVIYDDAKKQSAVEVVTGKVSVHKQKAPKEKSREAEGVLLKPNEKVIFNPADEVLITTLVEAPVPVAVDSAQTTAKQFDYDEAPLPEVIRDLETEYGISIIVGTEGLNHLRFTGNISSLDYYTKLKTVCKSLQVAYEVKGNRILMTRK